MAKALDGARIPQIKSLTVNTRFCPSSDSVVAHRLISTILGMKLRSFTINVKTYLAWPNEMILRTFSFMKKFTKLCEEGLSPQVVYCDLDGA